MLKKDIIIGVLVVVVIGVGAVLYIGQKGTEKSGGDVVSDACAQTCNKAVGTCPSLIEKENCERKCGSMNQETKDHLNTANSCQELTQKPELLADLLIPEVNNPEQTASNGGNDCEAACGSYVGKCLTLVPNATQALFAEGQASCESECAKWSSSKIACMVSAFNCEAMTNTCGL